MATGPASFDLTLLFDNDFADLFEVRGEKRPRRGIGSSKLLGPADVQLDYRGLDGKSRDTALHFDPRPTRLAVNAATYHFELAPQQASSLFVAVSCNKPAGDQAGRRSSAACWRIAAKCGDRRRAPPASKPRTTSSTRCCASRWPTSTC